MLYSKTNGIRAWHFVGGNRRMSHTDKLVRVGKTYSVKGPPEMCRHGFHGSRELLDAVRYAGMILRHERRIHLCRVILWGSVKEQASKVVATRRTVLEMKSATHLLHLFGLQQAQKVVEKGDALDPELKLCRRVMNLKKKLMARQVTTTKYKEVLDRIRDTMRHYHMSLSLVIAYCDASPTASAAHVVNVATVDGDLNAVRGDLAKTVLHGFRTV